MGMQRRLAIIGIGSAIALGLTGCGSSSDVSAERMAPQGAISSKAYVVKANGEIVYPEEQAEGVVDSKEANAETGADDVKEESTLAESTEKDAAEESDQRPLIGHCENGVYENAFFGIGCEVEDDDWVFMSEEELQQYDQASAEWMGFKDIRDALESGAVYTDMSASDPNGYDSLRVTIEKIKNTGLVYSENVHIESSAKTMPIYLKQMGATDIKTDTVTVNVFGEEKKALIVSLKMEDIQIYEAQICVIRDGFIVTCGAAGTTSEERVLELLKCFYALEQ